MKTSISGPLLLSVLISSFPGLTQAQSVSIVSPDGRTETSIQTDTTSDTSAFSTGDFDGSRTLRVEAQPGENVSAQAKPGDKLQAAAPAAEVSGIKTDPLIAKPIVTQETPAPAPTPNPTQPEIAMQEALKVREIIRFPGALFDSAQATLKQGSFAPIIALASALKASPTVHVTINGYTDNHGSVAYNLDLSKRRAQAVEAALIANGVDPKQMLINAYGLSHPIASNDTEEGRARNRRVDVVAQD